MTVGHCLHHHRLLQPPHTMHGTAARSDGYQSPQRATPMSEHGCHQCLPPGAPIPLHDPRIITRHAIRLTKAMVPRSVCELQDFSLAVISSSFMIPSVCVMYSKTKCMRCGNTGWKSHWHVKVPVACR